MSEEVVVEFEHPEAGMITLVGEAADEYVIGLIRATGSFYEAGLLDLLEHLGFTEGTAIDAGAHIGNHTIFFAKVLGLRTIAVEPRKESYDLLLENIDRNGVTGMVGSHNIALGAGPGRARLEHRVDGNTGAVAAIADPDGPVEVVRIDDLVSSDTDVVLIKVDVEGVEADVIEGARETIDRCRPVISTEAHSGAALDRIDRLLSEMAYAPVTIEGRSDNFIFASRSTRSPIPFGQAEKRAALLSRRRNEQILDSGLRTVSSRLKSVSEQMHQGHDDLRAEIKDINQVVSRLEELEGIVAGHLSAQTRRGDRFRYEYERLRRSRALRLAHQMRNVLGKVGLASEYRTASADEIESSLGEAIGVDQSGDQPETEAGR